MKLWKILRIAAWSCWGGIFVISIVAPESAALAAFFIIAFFPLMIASRIAKSEDPSVKKAKEERKARKEAEKRKQALDNRAVATALIWSDEHVRHPGSFGSAVIGLLVGGPAGAAVGAYLGKRTAKFAVQYASGRTGYETVDVNSERFKELSALLIE